MNKEDQLLKLSTTLYNQLNIIWARAIEGKGACYISSMERGDIEELLKEYNETKFPSLPAPPSSPTATAEEKDLSFMENRVNEFTLSRKPEDKGQTAEDILKKHFDEDWPEDMGVRGTAEEWEAFKENQPVFIKSMIEAMTEYASLKEQEAHNRAVQECIQILGDSETKEIALRELEKLKK